MTDVDEAKTLICELCHNMYNLGWVSGTGGGMSIKVGDKIVMAPSGVQKERMTPEDMFVLDAQGNTLNTPRARPPPYKAPKLSECSPLFMSAYELRGAGAVLHSHSINAVLATLLDTSATGNGCVSEFRVTNLEMIKGIQGHGYFDELVVPVIENTARECELTASLRQAIKNYPKSNAVLVRRHGVYVWGDNWIHAKTQAECYEYLFEAAVKLRSLGIDASKAPQYEATNGIAYGTANGHAIANGEGSAAKRPRLSLSRAPAAIVLDIEGTVAPISFVTDVLFPYARSHLQDHLEATFESEETQADLDLLIAEASTEKEEKGVPVGELTPENKHKKEVIVRAATTFVQTLMAEDRKSTGLKALQGHIWRQGFKSGELRSELYDDVIPALRQWHQQGIKVYIYSSGSREAQKNLFTHTQAGDLREHLSGFFDTTVGPKVVAKSYREIQLSLGVDDSANILFATDTVKEADAATAAGWQVALTVRPGNPALPKDAHKHFRVVSSMADLLEY